MNWPTHLSDILPRIEDSQKIVKTYEPLQDRLLQQVQR